MHEAGPAATVPDEIRGVLIPLQQNQLLLPNAAVAEVVAYQQPVAIKDAPDWVLGNIGWRQRNVTLVRLETLLGQSADMPGSGSRIVVCHSLNPAARRPFIGLLAAAIPHLVRVRESLLQAQDMDECLAGMPIHARLLVDGADALIPDLGGIEQLLAEHL